MKNINVILMLFVAGLFSSCGSDSTADLLAGVWNLTQISSSNCVDPSDNGVEVVYGPNGCDTFNGIEYCQEATWNFTSNNTVIWTTISMEDGVDIDTEVQNGTYTIQDDETMVELCFDGDCYIGTMVVSKSSFKWSVDLFGCTNSIEGTK